MTDQGDSKSGQDDRTDNCFREGDTWTDVTTGITYGYRNGEWITTGVPSMPPSPDQRCRK